MRRLANWWREFWPSVSSFKGWFEVFKKVFATIIACLPLIGLPNAEWTEWAKPLLPYWFYFTIPVWFLLIWKAAIAWYKTRGPVISTGPLHEHPPGRSFELTIRNVGSGKPTASAFVTSVTDESGSEVEPVGKIPLPWRTTTTPAATMSLFGADRGRVVLFTVTKHGEEELASVGYSTPLLGRSMLNFSPRIVTVTVVFEFDGDTNDKELQFVITPAETAPFGYRVERIK